MKETSKGMGFYFLIMLAVVVFVFIFRNGFDTRETYTYRQFEKALEMDRVARVDLHPNEQVPTGQLWVYFTDGSPMEKLNVADIKEVQEELNK